jgi:hypothetical protein
MAWYDIKKKPAWLQKTQNTFQSGADAVGDGVRSAGRAIDKHIIQPAITKPISRATKTDIASALSSLFRRSRFRRMPKPKVVQQVQKAAQKTADKVGQGAKDVAKQTGQAVTKAADKVGDVVRPAAQSVAKEVGHMVNPAIGEVALRGKQIAKASTPVLKRIGDKLGDAGRAVGDTILDGYTRLNPMPSPSSGGFSLTGEGPVEQPKRSQFLPFFTRILPDAIGDTAKGVLRTGEGILTGDGGQIISGLKRTGRGLGDTLKHTGLGTLEVLSGGFAKRPGDTIDASGAGGYGPTQNQNPQEKTESPVVETPQQKAEREEDEKTLAEYGQEAWDKFKDFSKMVIDEGIKPGFDSMDVKTKRMRYRDVASDAEIEVYRRAEAAGDKKMQKMMVAQWKYRQKYGRDYADDLMQGKTYQQ